MMWVDQLNVLEFLVDVFCSYVEQSFYFIFFEQVFVVQVVGFLQQLCFVVLFLDVFLEEEFVDVVCVYMKGKDGGWLQIDFFLDLQECIIVGFLVQFLVFCDVVVREWEMFDELVVQLCEEFDFFGIVIVVVCNGEIEQVVVGVCQIGEDVVVELGDCFYIGLISKLVIVMMFVVFVEEKIVVWDVMFVEFFFDVFVFYVDIWFEIVLRYQVQIQQYLIFDGFEINCFNVLLGMMMEQCGVYVVEVFFFEWFELGFVYLNVGYVFVGYVVE